jgi:nitroimidazol reductase NimA-like FMN-containing flavoprotein (pyridoxamine 5'-phosphate oxidase superfamily)
MTTVELTGARLRRLRREPNVWLSTVRDGERPHLVPVWFVYHEGAMYFCTDRSSVKVRNLARRPYAAMALEHGDHPIVCYGRAERVPRPWAADMLAAFVDKYDWDLRDEGEASEVWRVTPERWWGW